MKRIKSLTSILIFAAILLCGCKKETYLSEGNYINPPKDSISFGYRISNMYFVNPGGNETEFEFVLDTGFGYFWSEINISYGFDNSFKKYIPEYKNGYIVKLVDLSPTEENIEIEYSSVSPMYNKLVTLIKYYRFQNYFALKFTYDELGNLKQVSRLAMQQNGTVGGEEAIIKFCPNVNLGECSNTEQSETFVYSSDYNSLYHCNELVPFLFVLSKPKQVFLSDIAPELPYYFSRRIAQNSFVPIPGDYEYGLNKKEPTFLYFRRKFENEVEGYNFSMRFN